MLPTNIASKLSPGAVTVPSVEDKRKELKRMEALARASFPDRLALACQMAGRVNANNEPDRTWLGEVLGVSHTAVGLYVRGENVLSAYNNAMLARELGCNSHWLATGEEQPMSSPMTRNASADERRKVAELERLDETEQLHYLSAIYHGLSKASKELLLTEAVRIAEALEKADAYMRQQLGVTTDPESDTGAGLPPIKSSPPPPKQRASRKTSKGGQ